MKQTTTGGRSNLPAELSSFVGRRHELAQVRSLLAAHRLVTLIGPGGVGKTRLALRAAADLAEEYAEGVWVVELAPVHDPELVTNTVVAALRLQDASGASPVDKLVEHLQERSLLLVLDNCEHVQEAVAALTSRLLSCCTALNVVATSRHALGVEDEHLLPVTPLPVPSPGRDGRSPKGLMHYDSVRLFSERATASWPAFEVTDSNQQAVTDLVRRLD